MVQSIGKPTMKKLIALIITLHLIAQPILADDLVRSSADGRDWYFSMGGGDPYVNYRQTNRTTLDFNVGAEWSAFRGCSFDPRFSVLNTMQDIQEGLYGFAKDIADSAPTMVAAWGLSKLQSSFPDAYSLLTKGLEDAKASYTASVKTCRDMQSDIAAKRDPSNGWVRISKRHDWEYSSERGDNPVKTERRIDESGDRGVAWVGGKQRGGKNMPPIQVVGDTISAAYDHITKDQEGSPSNSVTGDERIARVFTSGESAAKWTTSVVGESTVRTCNDCNRLNTKMGQGLRLKHREERDKIDKDLRDALSAKKITKDHLDSLSAPGMGIVATEEVLRGLREAPANEQAILANRFASELALARVTEKALIARDLLNVGAQEPNIAANDTAAQQLERATVALDKELNNIVYEQEVKGKVINQSARVLSERGRARDDSERGLRMQNTTVKPNEMIDGGIQQ